ncbi:multi-sensor signal transduction histidine kinase [Oscillochloris trichoides DG-6]|uniref:Oxygen sensor histidine kinase NreB n=1 Tax=Oscillochloris trichoides DG-6 TaxID=765420 RepID=E1ID32_9CHLR|nr:sensor histidine kinase [Oscillochloris trichoides]EFO80903.1 multi-sensor signal transduction histidine kinase [Oscillochloris trichoides DG-6]
MEHLHAESVAYARELRELYRAAEQRAVRFRLLVEMGHDLVNARDIDGLLKLALVRATTFSGYERGSVFLRNPDGTLVERASIGEDQTPESQLSADLLHAIRVSHHVLRALQISEPMILSTAPQTSSEHQISHVYLPLIASNGHPLGVLLLLNPATVHQPDRDDLEALHLLAAQLATAIQSVQHHEDESTLVARLSEREQQLEELFDRLIGAQEEERRRIAYELHDGLGQMMLGALQQLHILADLYRPRSPRARAALDRAVEMVQASVTETRRVIAGLRPTVLDDFGLAQAIHMQVSSLRDEGWEIAYTENLGEQRLPAALEATLFRICQEALSNIRKHARTTQADIRIERGADGIELSIQDYGCGFDTRTKNAVPEPGNNVGLLGIQERVRLLGGTYRIESQRGQGTHIWVALPLALETGVEYTYERNSTQPYGA